MLPLFLVPQASLAGLSSKLEAAGAERLQLEHKLRLQRLEQAKATGTLQVGPGPDVTIEC